MWGGWSAGMGVDRCVSCAGLRMGEEGEEAGWGVRFGGIFWQRWVFPHAARVDIIRMLPWPLSLLLFPSLVSNIFLPPALFIHLLFCNSTSILTVSLFPQSPSLFYIPTCLLSSIPTFHLVWILNCCTDINMLLLKPIDSTSLWTGQTWSWEKRQQ